MYEKHIKKVRKSYEAKLAKAAEIFRTLSPDNLYWHVPEHGIFIWLCLPEHIEAEALEKRLEQHGILIKAAAEFFPEKWVKEKGHKNYNCVRLCISGVPEEHINAIGTILSVSLVIVKQPLRLPMDFQMFLERKV